MICQNCGATQPDGQAFCDQCGKKLSAPLPATVAAAGGFVPPPAGAAGILCPTCGQTNLPDSSFCEFCGQPLAQPGASAPAPAPQPPIQQGDSSPKTIAMPGAPLYEPPTQHVQNPVFPASPPPAAAPLSSTQRAPSFPSAQPGHVSTERMSTPEAPAGGAGPMQTIRYEQAVGPQPKLVAENGIVIAFKEGQTSWAIGREDPVSNVFPDVDLTPFDPDYTASRRHAQLSFNGSQAFLTSVTHTNWTKLNGTRMNPDQPVPIKPGDRIEFAKVVMVFQL